MVPVDWLWINALRLSIVLLVYFDAPVANVSLIPPLFAQLTRRAPRITANVLMVHVVSNAPQHIKLVLQGK